MTLEFKMSKPREKFHFNPPIQIKGDWMLGFISLEVYNSTFNIAEKTNQFELYTDPFDSDFPFIELKDKVAEVLGLSDITIENL